MSHKLIVYAIVNHLPEGPYIIEFESMFPDLVESNINYIIKETVKKQRKLTGNMFLVLYDNHVYFTSKIRGTWNTVYLYNKIKEINNE